MTPNAFFWRKKPNVRRLRDYGFVLRDDTFTYTAKLLEGQFELTVTISENGNVDTQVIDATSGDEYVLHRTPGAVGSFIGTVKAEYEAVLTKISDACFEPDVFKSDAAKRLISYVRSTYGDELEFLWTKFPDNAVWRRKDNQKWYGALLTISRRKLGLDSDEIIEIIDLRIKTEEMDVLIDQKKYFPGYHMNKKHWFTICLDGSVSLEEICRRIDNSYVLALGK